MSGFRIYQYCLLVTFGLLMVVMGIDFSNIPDINNLAVDTVTAEKNAEEGLESQFQLASLVKLSEVNERPLFVDGRQFKIIESPTTTNQPQQAGPPFNMEVTAIVKEGDKYMTVLRNKENNTEQTIFLGDNLPENYSEWQFHGVDNAQVIVKKNTEMNDDVSDSNPKTEKILPLSKEGQHYSISQE